MLTVDYRRLGLTPGHLVLDLGAGAGRHAFGALQRGARVVALDRSDAEMKHAGALLVALMEEADVGGASGVARGRGAATCGDALALPFADATFDRVIVSEVLEHIADDRAAMRELARVLRPGGRAAVTVPRWLPELVNWVLSDEYHLVPGGHIRIYRRSVLELRLRAAGLEVTGLGLAHGLHTPYWWLKCAVGVANGEHPLVRAYHRLLVWDIEHGHPLPTRLAEAALNPALAKSIVLYLRKPGPERPSERGTGPGRPSEREMGAPT